MGRKQQRLNKVVRPKLDSRIADYIQKQLDTDPGFDGHKETVLKYVREGPDTFYREYNDLKLANAVERGELGTRITRKTTCSWVSSVGHV
jgi:hypothetical protein